VECQVLIGACAAAQLFMVVGGPTTAAPVSTAVLFIFVFHEPLQRQQRLAKVFLQSATQTCCLWVHGA
jgi:hypothetical protein